MESFCRVKSSRTLNFDHSHHLEILKEALLRAIQDIDAKFSKAGSDVFTAMCLLLLLLPIIFL